MEDNKAIGNTQQQGIALEDRDGFEPLDQGAPQNWGVPKMDGVQIADITELLGIPMPGPGMAIPSDKTLMRVSVAWLTSHLDEWLMETKQAEDNASLTEAMESEAGVPPIDIYIKETGEVILNDGHHRLAVASDLGWGEIEAMVSGSLPPAFCEATTKKGKPCRAFAIDDSEYCYGHNR